MSRYAVDELIPKFKGTGKDISGVLKKKWTQFGILGWDDGFESYFLNIVDSHIEDDEGCDLVYWAFGRQIQEIKSPILLVIIIKKLCPDLDYSLIDKELINKLSQERLNYLKSAYSGDEYSDVLNTYLTSDATWVEDNTDLTKYITDDYLYRCSRGRYKGSK